jgi:hypothetical protein
MGTGDTEPYHGRADRVHPSVTYTNPARASFVTVQPDARHPVSDWGYEEAQGILRHGPRAPHHPRHRQAGRLVVFGGM